MSYAVKLLPGEPVIIVSFSLPFDPLNDVPEAYTEAAELSQTLRDTVFLLSDVSAVNLNLDDLINGLAMLRDALPKTKEYRLIGIGSSDMVKRAAQAMTQAQYGSVDVSLFSSLNDALARIRAELGTPS
jgi:hypothetical protein